MLSLNSDRERNETVFSKMNSHINHLQTKAAENPLSESEKVLEMEDVIDVCKQQIHNFD
jgi:hypothetical protein